MTLCIVSIPIKKSGCVATIKMETVHSSTGGSEQWLAATEKKKIGKPNDVVFKRGCIINWMN